MLQSDEVRAMVNPGEGADQARVVKRAVAEHLQDNDVVRVAVPNQELRHIGGADKRLCRV